MVKLQLMFDSYVWYYALGGLLNNLFVTCKVLFKALNN